MHEHLRTAALLGLLLVSGCDRLDLAIVPVSGVVSLNGRPLPNAKVMFQPDATGSAPSSEGTTDKSGRYRLSVTVLNRPGAIPGLHKVSVTTARQPEATADDRIEPAVEPLPARYNRHTTLFIDVPAAGTAEADFELKSP